MSEFIEGATTPASNNDSATTEAEQNNSTTETPAAEWVGDGKKYANVDELAKAYSHADQRLEELKLEVDRLASEKQELLTKSKSVDEVLEAIKTQSGQTTQTAVETQSGVSSEDVQGLVKQALDEKDRKLAVKATWQMVDEAFGDHTKASAAVKAYIGEDEGKASVVNSMALSDPAGLLKLLGKDVEKRPTTFSEEHSQGGSEQANLGEQLTWETAQKVRRTDPKLYYSHAFRKRMIDEIK